MADFHGEPTRVLENRLVRLEHLEHAARIVRLSLAGGPNLFADLGLTPIRTARGDFFFRGGHRLWHSPEAMPRTYIPDNEGATVSEIPNGVRIEAPAEAWTHISKSMEIQLNPDRPQVILRHELRNEGPWAAELAPWALTMFRLGGVGIFPQPAGNVDESGLLPNRRLSLWPYTHIDDPRLTLRDDFVLVRAAAGLPALKFGYYNPHGWMGYWIDGVLFTKQYDTHAGKRYPDDGCNAESYCGDQFIELESLGSLGPLEPGQTVTHSELWELHESLDVPLLPDEIRKVIRKSTGG
jgi:hypothetical protein